MRIAGLEILSPDAALLPTWYLRPSRWRPAITSVIKPGRGVAMHMPTRNAPRGYFFGGIDNLGQLISTIKRGFPEAFIPLETWQRTASPSQRGG